MKNKAVLRIVVMVIVSVVLAAVVELGFNARYFTLDSAHKGMYPVDLSTAQGEGATFDASGAWTIQQEEATITIPVEEQFVRKIQLQYTTESAFSFDLELSVVNANGQVETVKKEINKKNTSYRVTIPVERTINQLKMTFYPKDLLHPGSNVGSALQTLHIKNVFQFNPLRFGFFLAVFLLAVFLFVYRKYLKGKVELGFLVIALIYGTTAIVLTADTSISWDSQIHFANVYSISYQGKGVTQAARQEAEILAPKVYSIEDRVDQAKQMQQADQQLSESPFDRASVLESFGYWNQSILISLGRALHLPFFLLVMLGKFGNLILYCIVMYFAIKILKKGKMILATLALMPAPLFLSTQYSYDVVVFAFLSLAIALFISELQTPDKPIKWQTMLLFFISIIIGCGPKAIYIPVVLLGFMLPRSKFKDKRAMVLFRVGVVVVFLAMLSTFVLPTLISPAETGDVRGGNTSVAQQLRLILSHPIFYSVLLIKDSIIGQLEQALFSPQSLPFCAYLGPVPTAYLSIIVMFFVVFTDQYRYGKDKDAEQPGINWKKKLVFVLIFFVTACLIWTALYLSFTPVGQNKIAGVQNRYYFPIFMLLFLLFQTDKIKNKFSFENYSTAILTLCAGSNMLFVYSNILCKYAL